jgi:hypothetical protein
LFFLQALKLQAQARKFDVEGLPYQPPSRNKWDSWLRGVAAVSIVTLSSAGFLVSSMCVMPSCKVKESLRLEGITHMEILCDFLVNTSMLVMYISFVNVIMLNRFVRDPSIFCGMRFCCRQARQSLQFSWQEGFSMF